MPAKVTRVTDGDHAARIRAYFIACTSGSAADVASHFTEAATIFDTNVAPVHGREAIGRFWVRVREKWGGASWHVDSLIVAGDAAAIEWHMRGRAGGDEFVVRGSEHYQFTAGLIAEIRQYWTYNPQSPGSALLGYRYPDS